MLFSIFFLFFYSKWNSSIAFLKKKKRLDMVKKFYHLPIDWMTRNRNNLPLNAKYPFLPLVPVSLLVPALRHRWVLLIVTAQWMPIALIFSCLSWPLHSPLWSIKYTSHPGQPPIQHILIFLLHSSFFPHSLLSVLWRCCDGAALSFSTFHVGSSIAPLLLIHIFYC